MDAYRLDSLTRRFTPITLQEMDAVMLLDRTDTKFVLSTAQLLQALAAVQHDYRMLAVQGIRLNRYRTLYFDTADFALYHLHVNDRAERYKVRSREYTDSGLSFLEVKHKTRKDRTVKDRVPTARQVTQLSAAAAGWASLPRRAPRTVERPVACLARPWATLLANNPLVTEKGRASGAYLE